MTSIILIRSSQHLGGIERQLLDHALRLRRVGWHPQFVCLSRHHGEHPLAQAARSHDFVAHTIPDPHPASLRPLLSLRRLFATLPPALIHTCDYRSDILAWAARSGLPHVAESHGHTAENRRITVWNRFDIVVLRRLDAVIAVSSAWKAMLVARGVPSQHCHVIGNSTAILSPAPPPPPANLPAPGPHLLFAGRISPEKGLHLLLAAWALLRRRYPQAQLWILGDITPATAYRRHLSVQFQQAGIQVLGFQPDIRPWLQSVDVVVAPSRHEAWGMTVFESLCLGVPVVASAVGNLPELCQAAPHAHLIPGDDPAAIVAGIRHVLAPSFPHGPDLGQRYCQQPHFAPAQRFQQWLALYSSVMLSGCNNQVSSNHH